MQLHNIVADKSCRLSKKRLGRGPGSGRGKTAGKGHGGSKKRSGYSAKIGFEGGRIPLYRTLPKRGFNNFKFRKNYQIINLEDLNRLKEDKIDQKYLLAVGLLNKRKKYFKILGNGTINRSINVLAKNFSAKAKAKIEKAGGKIFKV